MFNFSVINAAWLAAHVLGAAIVIGLLAYIKRFFKDKQVPWQVWHIALIPISALAGLILAGARFEFFLSFLAVLMFTQLAYKPLVKLPETLIEAAAKRLGKPEGGSA